ncbi:death-associated protein kinase 2-like [Homalodisca vitripennis]|uniref:death-associated protein kinase 2-like n=1 Tax=Homalodisca vitripennis TaxID=197043 RepID=UPI001EEA2D9E|nr:death-associated protein kinase 2-like [Homalodisca vitripennis]
MSTKYGTFEDEYDVFEELGKGHFAVVKRCVNKTTSSQYAGKLIRKKRVCRGVSHGRYRARDQYFEKNLITPT